MGMTRNEYEELLKKYNETPDWDKSMFSKKDVLADVTGKIENPAKFEYNLNEDALYQQYADQYTKMGKMASEDTMGKAAALTGGYGNSYAATAANQAYNSYMQDLGAIVPDLYALARDEYNAERTDLYDQYKVLMDEYALEEDAYNANRKDMYDRLKAEEDNFTDTTVDLSGVPEEVINKVKSAETNDELEKYLDSISEGEGALITPDVADELYEQYANEDEVIRSEQKYSSLLADTSNITVVSKGGANWDGGIDEDAVINIPGKGKITLADLKESLIKEGKSESEATEFILSLQEALGISSNLVGKINEPINNAILSGVNAVENAVAPMATMSADVGANALGWAKDKYDKYTAWLAKRMKK